MFLPDWSEWQMRGGRAQSRIVAASLGHMRRYFPDLGEAAPPRMQVRPPPRGVLPAHPWMLSGRPLEPMHSWS